MRTKSTPYTMVSFKNYLLKLDKADCLIKDMGASKNRGTPKSSILIGFSIINHPFWGTPIFGNTHMDFHTHKNHPIWATKTGDIPTVEVVVVSPPEEPLVVVFIAFNKQGYTLENPPKWMVYFMENPIKIDDLGVPLFLETPIYIHLHPGSLTVRP